MDTSQTKELSIQYKEKGNYYFSNQNYDEALKYFSKAIVTYSISPKACRTSTIATRLST
jgi:tetratricopeptide (TPR) repeat protein